MRKIAKKLSAIALCTVFSVMQVSAASITTGDTGLGVGNGGAVINGASGGYIGTDLGTDSATLKFDGNAHVDWDTLNVNKGESLNFNAVDGTNGITVVNTVKNGMTNVYGEINSNSGIAKLIISNPNGMLFDGAKFTTAGDLLLTTQALAVNYLNGSLDIKGLAQEATAGIVIKDGTDFKSNFKIGGEFNIVAPTIEVLGGYIGATKGLNLITKDGHSFLICPKTSNNIDHKAVRLKSVEVDGNVYILSGEGVVTIVEGGDIKGDLAIESKGNVGLNYTSNGKVLNVTGNLASKADGKANIVRNATVGGNLDMTNSGGYVEVGNTKITGNTKLITTSGSNDNYRHYVHVIGKTITGGDMHIDSRDNIHIGSYDSDLKTLASGSLEVGGKLDAISHNGNVAVTIDTSADKVALTSEKLNIITDGKAVISANDYEFAAKHYIGGLTDVDYLINTVMEDYQAIKNTVVGDTANLNIAGGNVNKFEQDGSSYAFLKSQGDMNIDNVKAGKVYMASDKDIIIKDNVSADIIKVGGETRNLTVKLPNRDYKLKYTNIKDTAVITVDGDTEITYDMANGENGWNKGVQTAKNTYLVVPGGVTPPPVVPPVEPPVVPPSDPDTSNDDAEKVLRNLSRDEVASAIESQQVMTPVAFAADLDDEIDAGVRKNVDGSVTVVKTYTPED